MIEIFYRHEAVSIDAFNVPRSIAGAVASDTSGNET
jgi:hypothetical protein